MKRINTSAVRTATELGYTSIIPDICTRLRYATSETEIEQIMAGARHLAARLDRERRQPATVRCYW